MTRPQKKFSILWFGIQVVGQYAGLLVAFRFLLPKVWARQFAAGWPALLLAFLVAHLSLCFFEWAFHRYVLHSVTTSWLVRFARSHRSHHGLTPIRLQPVAEGVETPAQLAHLWALGCDFAQGYLFSPPLPADDFETLLQGRGWTDLGATDQ